ncbi:hypothetical protein LZ318_35310 [Saccharopolyspora indica]|uniref:hypothetical protein n=1 Tax=Saccharopolyspora indica TaxID=1229659 RepID=UPI0022EA284F|nr:hypothetical protein [Saccharopolyspora indica]MDA3647228.1 hypothetical protein [Saccharopolyspora indica]
MFWVQLSTFVLFNLLILALLVSQAPVRFAAGQHAGSGAGEYTVWHLIADVEVERAQARGTRQRSVPEVPPQFPAQDPDEIDPPTGRHHLREVCAASVH